MLKPEGHLFWSFIMVPMRNPKYHAKIGAGDEDADPQTG